MKMNDVNYKGWFYVLLVVAFFVCFGIMRPDFVAIGYFGAACFGLFLLVELLLYTVTEKASARDEAQVVSIAGLLLLGNFVYACVLHYVGAQAYLPNVINRIFGSSWEISTEIWVVFGPLLVTACWALVIITIVGLAVGVLHHYAEYVDKRNMAKQSLN